MVVKKVFNFLSQVWEELQKVTWPTRAEAIRMTLTVVIVSGLIAAFIGSLDFVLTRAVTKILTSH
ncbi:MAG: preprotein translocase subunit SecE [Candidatus Woykebacteria bacterium GWA1_44_8]|uniref:Protein translocase subunit SecE n=2 Tax=Microgenomates group TaxID=1794810 RepID=A0A1G1W1W2_9BACT|nr:MAG: Preprotein translocase, SecE subunit [Candidatus Woesebacteria bacterium GW2011_GWB1_45_5]OGY21387.1 MAG: preprotein translocase subunit SecE [Candidatus Woykebacteria bacterium GWA1_44_8]